MKWTVLGSGGCMVIPKPLESGQSVVDLVARAFKRSTVYTVDLTLNFKNSLVGTYELTCTLLSKDMYFTPLFQPKAQIVAPQFQKTMP
jgi:hypothetical protein